jgi:hypothetical protein
MFIVKYALLKYRFDKKQPHLSEGIISVKKTMPEKKLSIKIYYGSPVQKALQVCFDLILVIVLLCIFYKLGEMMLQQVSSVQFKIYLAKIFIVLLSVFITMPITLIFWGFVFLVKARAKYKGDFILAS